MAKFSNAPIPLSHLGEEKSENLLNVPFPDGISGINDLLLQKEESEDISQQKYAIEEINKWINSEIAGYEENHLDDLPPYRIIRGRAIGPLTRSFNI